MNSMGVGPSQQPDRSEQRPVMANRGRWAQIGPRFGALTLPCLLTLLLPGRAGWNGAVEDTTTAIAAALGQVGRV